MSGTRPAPAEALTAVRLTVGGRVQGVGFRPFVYRLARVHGIIGWVRNVGGRVTMHAQGTPEAVAAFTAALRDRPPPSARPEPAIRKDVPVECLSGFVIHSSRDSDATPHVPPDQFVCDDCLRELDDPRDRRYRYPFINCTQCGPRYTLIRALPYDRPCTTMAGFDLCPACTAEYRDPADRRFHAQPLACPACGPSLSWRAGTDRRDGNEPALAACLDLLANGGIAAVRGIGGYHLMCDATDDAAVRRLRTRKRRPHKPLAVMLPPAVAGDDWLDRVARPDAAQRRCLDDPRRPIVLAPARRRSPLTTAIAPDLDEIGLMRPYSPLHHLLLADFGRPVVATSGNRGGQPLVIGIGEAEVELADIADGFLHHDRPIARPADDPVYRSSGRGVPVPLRPGRGDAPTELRLARPVPRPLLAVGGLLKTTVALAWDDRVAVSPHVGDLRTPASRRLLRRVAADLQQLYGVRARTVVRDAHPSFPELWQSAGNGMAELRVFHHAAHASAIAGEVGQDRDLLVFTWDGVGYGEDGTLWGGEALVGRPGAWTRRASLRPFRLPGGDRVVEQPWRTALALCWETGYDWRPRGIDHLDVLQQAWRRRFNCPQTSAAGRLFDAAAALVGLTPTAITYEGQAPMRFEAAAGRRRGNAVALPLARDAEGVWRGDWAPLLPLLTDDNRPVAVRAADFHASLARLIADQATVLRRETGVADVALTGGVFQNRHLARAAARRLREAGFRLHWADRIPVNDAGLSFGQVIEAGARPAATGD